MNIRRRGMILPHLLTLLALLTAAHCDIHLEKITLTSATSTYTLSFPSTLAGIPGVSVSIESIDLHDEEFLLMETIENVSTSSITISLQIITTSQFSNSDYLKVTLFISYHPQIQCATKRISFNSLAAPILYSTPHPPNTSKLAVFSLWAPVELRIAAQDSNSFTLFYSTIPTSITYLQFSLSYIVIDQDYLSNHVLLMDTALTKDHNIYIISLSDFSYISPGPSRSLLGISSAKSSHTHFTLTSSTSFGLTTKMGYSNSLNRIESFNASVILFNQGEAACGQYVYDAYFEQIPTSCFELVCHEDCLTCTVSPSNSAFTSENFCTSCANSSKVLLMETQSNEYGKCVIPNQTLVNDDTQNQTEVQNVVTVTKCFKSCLTFNVEFIRFSSSPQFLLVFSQNRLKFEIPISENLIVRREQRILQHSISEHLNSGSYLIQIDGEQLGGCEESCAIDFTFGFPSKVRTDRNQSLSRESASVEVENYFSTDNQLPAELKQAFEITGAIIGLAAASGQTSLFRLLFELEQIIEFHKYLNINIPVVFNDFLQALSSFRFLDLTFFLPDDFQEKFKNISPDYLDNKGSIKAIYYDNGSSYYKNMSPIIFSFFFILASQFFLIFLLKRIPFRLTRRLGEKMKVRFVITFSDTVESIALPAAVYSAFQSSYVIMISDYIWVYVLQGVVNLAVVVVPFIIITIKMREWRRVSGEDRYIQKEVLEDLFQDCKISSHFAQLLYVYNYLRKFMLGVVLIPFIPGIPQVLVFLALNLTQLAFIIYLVVNKLYMSRFKVVTRSINIICIISIEVLILMYNVGGYSVKNLILIGITCTYLTIIATCSSILEFLIKICEIISQKIRGGSQVSPQENLPAMQTSKERKVLCHIGKSLNFPRNSQARIQNTTSPFHQTNSEDSSQEDNRKDRKKSQKIQNLNERIKRKRRAIDKDSDSSDIIMIEDHGSSNRGTPPDSNGEDIRHSTEKERDMRERDIRERRKSSAFYSVSESLISEEAPRMLNLQRKNRKVKGERYERDDSLRVLSQKSKSTELRGSGKKGWDKSSEMSEIVDIEDEEIS